MTPAPQQGVLDSLGRTHAQAEVHHGVSWTECSETLRAIGNYASQFSGDAPLVVEIFCHGQTRGLSYFWRNAANGFHDRCLVSLSRVSRSEQGDFLFDLVCGHTVDLARASEWILDSIPHPPNISAPQFARELARMVSGLEMYPAPGVVVEQGVVRYGAGPCYAAQHCGVIGGDSGPIPTYLYINPSRTLCYHHDFMHGVLQGEQTLKTYLATHVKSEVLAEARKVFLEFISPLVLGAMRAMSPDVRPDLTHEEILSDLQQRAL